MAIKIITQKKAGTQQNISDYIWKYTFEEIDLRTSEGKQRYQEIFGCYPNREGVRQEAIWLNAEPWSLLK